MEILVNEQLAFKRRRLARRLVLFGFIVLIGGLFIGARDARTVALSYGALVLGTILSWSGVAMMDRWVLPPKPEEALAEAMMGSNAGWKLYHWALPADHVVQAPWGLVVVEPFNFDGAMIVQGSRYRDRRGMLRRLFSIGRRPVRNPERLLDMQADALREALVERDEQWAELPIEGALILTHPRASLEAEDPNVRVHLASDMRRGLRADSSHRPLKPNDQRALRADLDAIAAQRLGEAGGGEESDEADPGAEA